MGNSATVHSEPIDIGTRLEPLIDDFLFAELGDSLDLRLHPPVKREVVLQTDARPGRATPVSTAPSSRTRTG